MSQTDAPPPPLPQFSLTGGVLSYLVPGLGQIAQGRVAKGLLFFVCLYGMFFYGLYLGNWQNVYVQQPVQQNAKGKTLERVIEWARFAGQFFIGAAAWPAFWQHYTYQLVDEGDLRDDPKPKPHPYLGKFQQMPTEKELNNQLRNSDKNPDLGVMYTIIAGVLNVLVIYDAFAGPAMGRPAPLPPKPSPEPEKVPT